MLKEIEKTIVLRSGSMGFCDVIEAVTITLDETTILEIRATI